MNINGLGNIYDRTYTTYRPNKNEQSFAELLEKADDSLDQKVENEDEKKDMPEEEKTRTDIVVRPDGSKILMITVTVGGQEAVTSVELAKPTNDSIPSKDISGDEIKNLKVTDIEVVSLNNGVSFYYNCDTGELQCINHYDDRPGRHALWSKTISPEDWERCDKLFDRYADMAAGQFVYRYQAYLKHEEFWDMYLEGKVDLRALAEKDDALSEGEIYDKFLRDMANHMK